MTRDTEVQVERRTGNERNVSTAVEAPTHVSARQHGRGSIGSEEGSRGWSDDGGTL